jgi:GT2 family glycosyltransferase
MSHERIEAPAFVLTGPGGLPADQAQPQSSAKEPARLVSVVVPCGGQLEYTRLSVLSLLRYSRRPFELIFADVASLDGTAEYLAGVAAAAPVRVEVVRAASEAGFTAAAAEALARARGDYLVWLNNDTIVSDGWLQQLAGLCGGHESIGMAGPMSNYAPQAQRVMETAYRIGARARDGADEAGRADRERADVEAVNRFAADWRERYRGQWIETERLGGFCLLLKRTVLQSVEFLDAQAGRGIFDADALCRRVRQAGYRLACCRDLFIHHFGSRAVAL